jgi:hypothetical protein
MKPATNMVEFARNLKAGEFITEKTQEFYVPIFEDILKKIRTQIIVNDNIDKFTFLVTGQSGTGKTSALNFLTDEQLSAKYEIVSMHGRELLDLNDVDIIDILLMIPSVLIAKHPDLEKKYLKKIDELQKVADGSLEKEAETNKTRSSESGIQGNGGVGFDLFSFVKLKMEAFVSYRREKQLRETIRQKFQIKKNDLVKIVNEIINDYYEIGGTKKKLLLIIDDLEKIRDPEQIRSLFIENQSYFRDIWCKKIITFPISLSTEQDFRADETVPEYFGLCLTDNPLLKVQSQSHKKKIAENRSLMVEIVRRRMVEGTNLIKPDAIEKAIDYSGGLIKQYIQLLYLAAINSIKEGTENAVITTLDVDAAIEGERNNMARSVITTPKIEMLKQIMDHHKPTSTNNDIFIKAIIGNQIIIYQNGDPWYDVNPIIRSTIINYSE